jgi:small conductance mechanosensitive channel
VPAFDPKHPWRYAKTVPMAQSAYFLVPLGQFFLLIAVMILTLEAWGLNFINILSTPQTQKYILTGLSLFLILAGIRILWALIDLVATSQLQDVEVDGVKAEPHLFTKTIVPIVRSTLKGIIAFVGFLLILSELAFDVTPIIYSLTFISLAISFGAQTMVKDVITGFLTLFEGNIKVGEYVTIGQHSGTVEAISLRSVFLRHGNGAVQSIPFSEVGYIINRSRHYTEHTITVAASHTTPVHRVYDVIMETYKAIKDHPRFGKMIIASIKINGVSHFTDTAIYVTAGVQTKPDPPGQSPQSKRPSSHHSSAELHFRKSFLGGFIVK